MLAYIGIGSNLNDPMKQLRDACRALKQLPDCQFIRASSGYISTPMGPQAQPDYANAVILLDTQLSCRALLRNLQNIEQQQGRQRDGQRWGPRTLDLDIILYGNETLNEADLIVPHYGCKAREFVIYPLAEIAPELIFPDGEALHTVKQRVPLNGLQRVSVLD
ncbi:MAG: 2-amino-4-hydroxy-6-hydroxymethyldihydropteridine diphosphokinase [Aestuariibacter sp.]